MKPNNVHPKATNSRKAMRQNKRLQKKINRNEHYTNKKKVKQIANIPGQFVKLATDSKEKGDMKKKVCTRTSDLFINLLNILTFLYYKILQVFGRIQEMFLVYQNRKISK